MRNRILSILLCLCLLAGLLPHLTAEADAAAVDISDRTTISGTGFDSLDFLTDKDLEIYVSSTGNARITLQHTGGIGSLYLLFDLEYGAYTVTDNSSGKTITAGEDRYLHEFIDLTEAFSSAPTSVTIRFNNGAVHLSEIYTFSEGQVPGFVQKWDKPHDSRTDLLLFSTHGDDEQLFFAGLLPYYAGALGLNVQVVYMTDHRNMRMDRTHEILNGLWAVGVDNYPVLGPFNDFRIDHMENTYIGYESLGVTREELLGYVVENVRRFKPLVVVGHDIAGEYGHGMHMVYTDCLIKALPITADADSFPESAQKYGVWDIPKTYLHLYEQNPITINYDIPLDAFNGLTAFQVTQQLGFPCHLSQQKTWFVPWIYGEEGEITKASQIVEYSPCQFGLYRSTVGADVKKNDFMENVHSYDEQDRLEQERIEQEKLEQERLEQERIEQERLEKERLEAEKRKQQRQQALMDAVRGWSLALLGVSIGVLVLYGVVRYQRNQRRRKSRKRTASTKRK